MISTVWNRTRSLFNWRSSSNTARRDRFTQVQAKYDAAQTNELNKKYWGNADSLSADEANSPEVRAELRKRSRYCCHESDSVLKGVVHTLANDVIGKGPRLQMQLQNQQANRQIEWHFNAWARQVKLAKKLRLMRLTRCVDGEAFAQLVTNRKLRHAVKLDLKLFDAERCTTPDFSYLSRSNRVDGIEFDDDG